MSWRCAHYARRETECRPHDITLRRRACCAGRETRWRQYDTAPKRRASNERRETKFCSYDTTTPSRRANCARTEIGWRPYDTPNTVHVAKPDAVCVTLHKLFCSVSITTRISLNKMITKLTGNSVGINTTVYLSTETFIVKLGSPTLPKQITIFLH